MSKSRGMEWNRPESKGTCRGMIYHKKVDHKLSAIDAGNVVDKIGSVDLDG